MSAERSEPSSSRDESLPQGARVGQIVAGKYRIERLLGRGGMGEVYEARHLVVGRRFAIKFLQERRALAADSATRFLLEAQAAGALDSEHITAVLDFDRAQDGAPFLVMEYLSGESVARILAREGRLPVPRALDILLQVGDGLEVAHEARIVHRDLKPDNLFVVRRTDGSDLVKILDFGIAKLLGDGPDAGTTHSGAVLGTPFYMAPEQARGEKTVDHRVDIYALGVIGYELLSGQKPHPGDGYNAILAHILTQPVLALRGLRPDLPIGLAAVIERALAFDPAARHASVSAFVAELSPFAGREIKARDSQFDLRRGAAVTSSAATLGSHSGSLAPAGEGTLGSAVGSVPRPAQAKLTARSPWLLAAFVALLAASLSRALLTSETSHRDAPAAIALPKASATAQPPVAPSPLSAPAVSSALPSATSAATPSAVAKPVSDMAAKATRVMSRSAPSSAAVQPQHPAASEVHFDEKNPY
ncbi:MAG TPA: protein kinase [Polyangiaceae bacterium]